MESFTNIAETISLSNQLLQRKLDSLEVCISVSGQVVEIIEEHKAKQPFRLNVIEAACRGHFKETGHSLVLAEMLKHPKIQASFLKEFLGMSYETMEVTAEKDRVDVALKGKNMFVIVENKVNGARERKNQVYGYVHEIGIGKYGFDMPQIYVVYLNPIDRSRPTGYSLCDENGENNVFDALGGEHYRVLSYKYDITEWLRKISIEGEPHILSALDQYIGFLENKFHTSKSDEIMNNEIKAFILDRLQVDAKPFAEQIDALNGQRENAYELLNAIDNIKVELSHVTMREWQKQIEQQLGISLNHDEHSFGTKLNNGVWLGVWDAHDNPDKLPYWGFEMEGYKKDSMPGLYEGIEKLIKDAGITRYRPEKAYFLAWCSTKKGVERFVSLYRSAKKAGLL